MEHQTSHPLYGTAKFSVRHPLAVVAITRRNLVYRPLGAKKVTKLFVLICRSLIKNDKVKTFDAAT